ncbi:MAG: hypothetical protein QOD99_863 [Chthoniobacter sp.]|jgi:predicted phosphodiesterase|nr:hypothetical protein [Chthoniobacter sp.]
MARERIAVFGGVYSNHLALSALLNDVRQREIMQVFCLGDLGAFGPCPDKVFPLLRDAGVQTIQGNYDNSIGHDLADCQCGYTDPRDNYFAKLSYDYTYRNTSPENKVWMRGLPCEIRLELGGKRVLLCHGSPRQTNEFVWETTSSSSFLERLCAEHDVDVVVGTHSGLHWQRALANGKQWINCGVIGRPANDGATNVWYAILSGNGVDVDVEFVPLAFDHAQLAAEMRAEKLPEEFVQTIETGWWTTCLEVLPMKERARGRF